MAFQASVQHLLLGNARESNDICSVTSLNMLPSRPVAAFTAGAFRRLLLRNDALVMGIFIESVGDVGMAGLACLTADVFIVTFIVTGSLGQVRGCRLLCTGDSYRKQ